MVPYGAGNRHPEPEAEPRKASLKKISPHTPTPPGLLPQDSKGSALASRYTPPRIRTRPDPQPPMRDPPKVASASHKSTKSLEPAPQIISSHFPRPFSRPFLLHGQSIFLFSFSSTQQAIRFVPGLETLNCVYWPAIHKSNPFRIQSRLDWIPTRARKRSREPRPINALPLLSSWPVRETSFCLRPL